MYASHITVKGTHYAAWESIRTVPHSARLPSPLKEAWSEKVAAGLVSDLPGPNCTRIVDEAAFTTTFVNTTWITQEAAQQFIDVFANNYDCLRTAVVEI